MNIISSRGRDDEPRGGRKRDLRKVLYSRDADMKNRTCPHSRQKCDKKRVVHIDHH